jgi:hypothetical protein
MYVLILVLVEYGLRPVQASPLPQTDRVLILVLVEYGLRRSFFNPNEISLLQWKINFILELLN